ncbi:MAG: hypothetical protein H8K04_01725 [Nitrospira sp.]
MASRLKSVTLCNLCEKVYDPNRSLWVKVNDYRAYHGEPADSYVFTEAICDACHTLYATMIGTRNKANRVTGSTVDDGFIAALAPDGTATIDYGLA